MIKLINYPYKDWKVGETVDLGKVKNESMIAMNRAIAITILEPIAVVKEEVPTFEAVEGKINYSKKKSNKVSKHKN